MNPICDKIIKEEKRIQLTLIIYQMALMLFFAVYFSRYFPNNNFELGHDYGNFFAQLLDGYYWFLENGFLKVPWFSPAFCGGLPSLPNPQNMFYSIPQLLTIFMGPLFGIFLSVIIFAWLGYIGTYFLLRNVFNCDRIPSALAATIFLMNGFFVSRMIIGHLAFHSFMLIPFLCYFLLLPVKENRSINRMHMISLFYCIISSLIIAYMFYSGLHILLQVIFSVLAIACIYGSLKGSLKSFIRRFIISGIISLAICSAKLLPLVLFIKSYPRNLYKLPGTDLSGGIELFFRSLFLPGSWSFTDSIIQNYQWTPEAHDYDYNITPIPFILIITGIILIIKNRKNISFQKIVPAQLVYICLFALTLSIPYLLNLYIPWWQEILKSIPIIKSSSSMIRWYVIYIMPFLIIMAIVMHHTCLFKKNSLVIFIISVVGVVSINVFQPVTIYHDQYKPGNILTAYFHHKKEDIRPRINKVMVFTNQKGEYIIPSFANDMIAFNASQMLCYEPIFGYKLEQFPRKTLHPGSITSEKDGFLNLKNPACYIYPEENSCLPGDHFTVIQKDEMLSFASYHGYKFNMPKKQVFANWLSVIVLSLSIIYLVIYGFLVRRF